MTEELTDEEIQHLKQSHRDQKYYSAIVLGGITPIMLYSLGGVVPNLKYAVQPHMPTIVFASIIISLLYQYYQLNIKNEGKQ